MNLSSDVAPTKILLVDDDKGVRDEVAGYLERNGEAALSSVGCYQLEGEGVQLFEKIDGDFFSILGLPLLPLLDALRREGVIEG